jgi:hypothetical protein
MKHCIDQTFRVLFIIPLSFSFAACSNNSELGSTSELNNSISISHTHPANKCIDAVTHSHPNGNKKHLHYFHHCEASGVISNAHSHPSKSSITGFFRHVHPNGANKHTHTH